MYDSHKDHLVYLTEGTKTKMLLRLQFLIEEKKLLSNFSFKMATFPLLLLLCCVQEACGNRFGSSCAMKDLELVEFTTPIKMIQDLSIWITPGCISYNCRYYRLCRTCHCLLPLYSSVTWKISNIRDSIEVRTLYLAFYTLEITPSNMLPTSSLLSNTRTSRLLRN